MKEWHSADMTKDLAEKFKAYLFENGLEYEPSENGNLVHFEVLMTINELRAANDWINEHL